MPQITRLGENRDQSEAGVRICQLCLRKGESNSKFLNSPRFIIVCCYRGVPLSLLRTMKNGNVRGAAPRSAGPPFRYFLVLRGKSRSANYNNGRPYRPRTVPLTVHSRLCRLFLLPNKIETRNFWDCTRKIIYDESRPFHDHYDLLRFLKNKNGTTRIAIYYRQNRVGADNYSWVFQD